MIDPVVKLLEPLSDVRYGRMIGTWITCLGVLWITFLGAVGWINLVEGLVGFVIFTLLLTTWDCFKS